MEDKDIVNLYWNRDESAIKETASKYEGYCGKIAYNILFDYEDAKDCVNETYLKTWNSIPNNRPNNLRTYVGKICRNISINLFEKYSAEKRSGTETDLALDELNGVIGDKDNVREYIDYSLLKDSINDFLSNISKNNRIIFVKRYFYLFNIEEIAKQLSLSNSAVKMSLKRTRDDLRTYLIGEGYNL